jgi:hypothetical protein
LFEFFLHPLLGAVFLSLRSGEHEINDRENNGSGN